VNGGIQKVSPYFLINIVLLIFTSGCEFILPPSPGLPTLIPTAILQEPANSTPLPTPTIASSPQPSPTIPPPTPLPDTGWQLLKPGLERRIINLFDNDGRRKESLYLLRLEPALFRFSIGYHPGLPLGLNDWQRETEALIVINGGFFTLENTATGLIIVDGQVSGTSYQGFGGMLAISENGPEIRWLVEKPYEPSEPLLHALQSFPMLVKPGETTGYSDVGDLPSRRTVVAQDVNGRFLFILAPWGSFTLHQLSQFLLESDLELEIALNLDGGSSTGLILREPAEGIPAFSVLPAVILIHDR